MVAVRSAGVTGLSVTSAAWRSVRPWMRPAGTPAPANNAVLAYGSEAEKIASSEEVAHAAHVPWEPGAIFLSYSAEGAFRQFIAGHARRGERPIESHK